MNRGSRDHNHNPIAQAFIEWGCTVADMALSGVPGFPDLVVGCIGVSHLVEIKNPATAYGRAGLTVGQSAFARDWRGGRVWVVREVSDVGVLVRDWRKAATQAMVR